jgi:hypothetical protein
VAEFGCSRCALANPLVDLGELELPELAYLSGRQTLPIDPSIDGVLRDPEVLREVVDGNPRLALRSHFGVCDGMTNTRGQSSSAKLIRQQSLIVADSRKWEDHRRSDSHGDRPSRVRDIREAVSLLSFWIGSAHARS